MSEKGILTLTAMLVLSGREALITDTNIGALQVLAGSMGQTQARVLAALIYICERQESRKLVQEWL